jgi:hypothetical protein
MHSVDRPLAIYWNTAACTSCGSVPNAGPSEATVQPLLSIGLVAFLWKRRAWIPRCLREARAAHPVDPTRSNYRIHPMLRRPAPAHP